MKESETSCTKRIEVAEGAKDRAETKCKQDSEKAAKEATTKAEIKCKQEKDDVKTKVQLGFTEMDKQIQKLEKENEIPHLFPQ